MVVANEDVQSSPWVEPDNRVSLSFKVHGGFSSPLINFSGSDPEQLKRDIVAVFGNLEVEDLSTVTAFELLAKAHEASLAVYNASEILGATVDAVKSNGGGNRWQGKPKSSTETESVGRREKPADPNQGVLDAINGASSQAEVLTIFTRHSTGDMKTNSGWPTAEQAAAAKAKFAEFNKKKEQG